MKSTQRLALAAALFAAFAVQAQTPTTTPAGNAADAGKGSEALAAAFKRADANGDGKLSREEAARIPAIADKFDSYDKDKDGLLTLEELSAGMATAK